MFASPSFSSSSSVPEVGAENVPLDSIGSFSSTQDFSSLARRRSRWRLKSAAARLLPDFGVSTCGTHMVPGASGVTVFRGVTDDSSELRTWLGGVATCKSVWCCPICSAKITERRRHHVLAAVEAAKGLGLKPVMVTLTYSHSATQSLLVGKVAISEALIKLKSGRAWQKLKAKYGVVGSIRALEVTHGEKNGWHPHSHELMFVRADADTAALGAEICLRWLNCLGALGLSGSEAGFSITGTNAAVSEYIAKFGKEPRWDVGRELTKLHSKVGRSRAYDEHSTPFQLLAYAADGDSRCAALFQEFARVFRGAKQLFWSQGLWDLLIGGDEISDEELIETLEEVSEPVCFLHPSEWIAIVANDAIADFLHVCAVGDSLEIERWLDGLFTAGADV